MSARKVCVTFTIDLHSLANRTDPILAALWHVAQANPAPITDVDAINAAEMIGREIIRRWLSSVPPLLWKHQASHAATREREAASPSTQGTADS